MSAQGLFFVFFKAFFFVFAQLKVQMEMLQMDLEDNETAMTSYDGQVQELKGAVDALEAQLAQKQILMLDMEAMLEESKAQVIINFV